MKFQILGMIAALIFSGCSLTQNSSHQLQIPAKFNALNLPETITIDGETFTRAWSNADTIEYYRAGERGYGWSKLVTIVYSPNTRDIDLYVRSVRETHATENKTAPRHYEINKLSATQVTQKILYYPVAGDANFDNYELDLAVSELQSCGLVIVLYAQKFDKSQSKESLIKLLNENQVKFPKVECKK